MKKILVLTEMTAEQKEELKKLAPEYEMTEIIDPEDSAVEIVYGYNEEFEEAFKEGFSGVRWIQFPFAGVNQLPLDLFAERGVFLTNGSGIHASSMTETIFGHLLSYTRNFKEYILNQEKHVWNYTDWSFDLTGKKFLIIGLGKIGNEVAKVAKAFNMEVIGVNRSGHGVTNVPVAYPMSHLSEVIHEADIVLNLLPLTKETTHFYDEKLFSQMKQGVLFINMGRGGSVVTEDLMAALNSGQIAFAGLDVFEEEPLPENHPLWDMEQVTISPHIGGVVENYPVLLFAIFKENIVAFQNDKVLPVNLVDLEKGY